MNRAILTLLVSVLSNSASAAAEPSKLQRALAQATAIVEAEVIRSTPVGHGHDSVQVSHFLRITRALSGAAPSDAVWVDYTTSKNSPRLGSHFETSLRPGDRRIFLLFDDAKVPSMRWKLLRVEPLASREAILSATQR